MITKRSVAASYNQWERRNQSTESILLIFLDHYYLEPHDQDDNSYKISVGVEAILPAYGTPTEHPTVDTHDKRKTVH
jgi:hypothetical protein